MRTKKDLGETGEERKIEVVRARDGDGDVALGKTVVVRREGEGWGRKGNGEL